MGHSHFSSKAIPLRPQLAMFLEENGGLGIEKALFLQQIHYLCTSHQETGNLKYFHDNKWWVNISYGKMRSLHLFFLPLRTLERVVAQLSKQGILIVAQIDAATLDQQNWYTINHDLLDKDYVAWLGKLDYTKNYIPSLAEDYAMLTGKQDHLQHEPFKKRRTVKPKNVTTSQNATLPSRQSDGINPPERRDDLYEEILLKETLKTNPTLTGQGGAETSLIDSWQPWLSKYKGGKKVWLKAKPAGLDDLHSHRWDCLFYAIAEHVRELPDFKNQPEAIRAANAGQLCSMVGSVFSYLWLDTQHIQRFVELYRQDSDASLPSSLDTFPQHLAKYTVELEALDKPIPQVVPASPEPEPTPDSAPVDKGARKSLWDDIKKGDGK